jgi:hypothetical protein
MMFGMNDAEGEPEEEHNDEGSGKQLENGDEDAADRVSGTPRALGASTRSERMDVEIETVETAKR